MEKGKSLKRLQRSASPSPISPLAEEGGRTVPTPKRVSRRAIRPVSRRKLASTTGGEGNRGRDVQPARAPKKANEAIESTSQEAKLNGAEQSIFDFTSSSESGKERPVVANHRIPNYKPRTKWAEVWYRRSLKETVQGRDDGATWRPELGEDLERKAVKTEKFEGEGLNEGISEM